MNRHFEDTRYYLKRTGETASKGVREELEPVATRVRRLAGAEVAPEPSRLDALEAALLGLQARVEGEAAAAIGTARKKVAGYRGHPTVEA